MRGERPIFVHKLEFAASFPAGKYNKNYFFNPGNGFYYINPSWSATFYIHPRLAASCNLNYLWSSQNKKTKIQPGQAIFLNYSIEAECFKNTWLAIVGYFLQQYTDSKINNIPVPGRRERVFAIGPGMLYRPNNNLDFFGYIYFESKVKNRTKGTSGYLTFVIHF